MEYKSEITKEEYDNLSFESKPLYELDKGKYVLIVKPIVGKSEKVK